MSPNVFDNGDTPIIKVTVVEDTPNPAISVGLVQGTVAYALAAGFASNVANSITSSYSISGSSTLFAVSASYATASANATTAATASLAVTSSFAVSSSYAVTSSFAVGALSASWAPGVPTTSASYAQHATSADTATSASYATTASFALNGGSGAVFGGNFSGSFSGSLSGSALLTGSFTGSFVGDGTNIINVVSSSYAATASLVQGGMVTASAAKLYGPWSSSGGHSVDGQILYLTNTTSSYTDFTGGNANNPSSDHAPFYTLFVPESTSFAAGPIQTMTREVEFLTLPHTQLPGQLVGHSIEFYYPSQSMADGQTNVNLVRLYSSILNGWTGSIGQTIGVWTQLDFSGALSKLGDIYSRNSSIILSQPITASNIYSNFDSLSIQGSVTGSNIYGNYLTLSSFDTKLSGNIIGQYVGLVVAEANNITNLYGLEVDVNQFTGAFTPNTINGKFYAIYVNDTHGDKVQSYLANITGSGVNISGSYPWAGYDNVNNILSGSGLLRVKPTNNLNSYALNAIWPDPTGIAARGFVSPVTFYFDDVLDSGTGSAYQSALLLPAYISKNQTAVAGLTTLVALSGSVTKARTVKGAIFDTVIGNSAGPVTVTNGVSGIFNSLSMIQGTSASIQINNGFKGINTNVSVDGNSSSVAQNVYGIYNNVINTSQFVGFSSSLYGEFYNISLFNTSMSKGNEMAGLYVNFSVDTVTFLSSSMYGIFINANQSNVTNNNSNFYGLYISADQIGNTTNGPSNSYNIYVANNHTSFLSNITASMGLFTGPVSGAFTGSFTGIVNSASYASTASFVASSSYAITSSNATTASYALVAQTLLGTITSASNALTASALIGGTLNVNSILSVMTGSLTVSGSNTSTSSFYGAFELHTPTGSAAPSSIVFQILEPNFAGSALFYIKQTASSGPEFSIGGSNGSNQPADFMHFNGSLIDLLNSQAFRLNNNAGGALGGALVFGTNTGGYIHRFQSSVETLSLAGDNANFGPTFPVTALSVTTTQATPISRSIDMFQATTITAQTTQSVALKIYSDPSQSANLTEYWVSGSYVGGISGSGDVVMNHSGSSLVLLSPNGTRFKITVSNAGSVTATQF